MEYYTRIRNAREDKDWKQYEFAKEVGINHKAYNFYETGTRKIPLDVMDRIVSKLEISFDYAFEIDGDLKHDYVSANIQNLGKKMREIRKEKKLSQIAISSLIGCSQQSLSQYEKGKDIPPEVLKRFCQEFGLSADVLLERREEKLSTDNCE